MAKNKKRVAEKNLGLFMAPDMGSGGGGFLVPTKTLEVGPGESGPGDEWVFPDDTVVPQADDGIPIDPDQSEDKRP